MTLDLFTHGLQSSAAFAESAFGFMPAQAASASPAPVTPKPAAPVAPKRNTPGGKDFRMQSGRKLASGWKQRAADNLTAIRLAAEITAADRPATADEQAQLARFISFGASALANNVFRRPGETEFRPDWSGVGVELEQLVSEDDYASLARCTQYAHFTPETIVRAIWAGLQRLGFRGGRVLEPGVGTGMFPALVPEALSKLVHFTGIEIDPVTAHIARLLQPSARPKATADLSANDFGMGRELFGMFRQTAGRADEGASVFAA